MALIIFLAGVRYPQTFECAALSLLHAREKLFAIRKTFFWCPLGKTGACNVVVAAIVAIGKRFGSGELNSHEVCHQVVKPAGVGKHTVFANGSQYLQCTALCSRAVVTTCCGLFDFNAPIHRMQASLLAAQVRHPK